MKATPAALALFAIVAASSVGVHAQGGATIAAATRLATPAPTGSMGALTKAASAVRTSRAAALAGKGLTGAGTELGRSTQIMGYLWTSNNGAMTNARVQIRNTVTNSVERVATTNAAGEFVFQNITPGEYVIEYVSDAAGKSIIAIGHPFTVSPGETVATFVRVTNGLPMLLPNELSNLSSGVAAQAVSSAATQGITSIATPLVSIVPPVVPKPNDPTPPPPPPVVSAIK